MKRTLFFTLLLLVLPTLFLGQAPIPRSLPEDAKLVVHVIDVGMGDAIFLDIPPKDCMLIDGGSWDKPGVENLKEFLKEFFDDPDHAGYKKTLDVVVASHQHHDHIAGLIEVLKAYKVETYVDNGIGWKKAKNSATDEVDEIDKLILQKKIRHLAITDELINEEGKNGVYTDKDLDPFDNIDVFALAGSPTPIEKEPNDNSIILRIECGKLSFLLAGDAQEKEEKRVIKKFKDEGKLSILDVDVYKASHHGSNTSNSGEMLRATTPLISVISVGKAEESSKTRQFRLPKESAVDTILYYTSNILPDTWEADVYPDKAPKNKKEERPKKISSRKEVYLTSSDGTVVIRTDGKTVKVDEE